MAEDNTDRHPNGGRYLSPTGRARGLLVALAGGRGQRSPPPVGRGLGVPQTGRGRGLQPHSHPWVGSGRSWTRALLQELVQRNHPQSSSPNNFDQGGEEV